MCPKYHKFHRLQWNVVEEAKLTLSQYHSFRPTVAKNTTNKGHISGVQVTGQQSQKRCPDLPLPSPLFQLFQRDTKVLPETRHR